MTDVIRRKHFTLGTEQCYCGWLRRYCDFIVKLPGHISSEQKLERFLTELARKDISASTQNQAFNAINFFYTEVMSAPLENIRAVRARRPVQVRRAPSREETLRLIKAVQAEAGFTIGLGIPLLYGGGLRVAEPLGLRIKLV